MHFSAELLAKRVNPITATVIYNDNIMELRSGNVYNSAVGNIKKCDKDCLLCKKYNALDFNTNYSNVLTKEAFTIRDSFSCDSQNVIYLISCRDPFCQVQYVGKTISTLKKRYSSHRSGLRTGNEPKHLLHHFTHVHKPSDMIIKPLAFVNDGENIKEIENNYILKLNTLYPYGLNDRLEKPQYLDAQATFNDNGCIYKLFPKLTNVNLNRKRGKRVGRNNIVFDPHITFLDIKWQFDFGNLAYIRSKVASLNIEKCNILGSYCIAKRTELGVNHRFLDIIIDLCNHYRYRSLDFEDFCDKKVRKDDDFDSEFIPILLKHKNIDKMTINKIFNSNLSHFPRSKLSRKYQNDKFRHVVCYKYSKPIRNKVLNYFSVFENNSEFNNIDCCCEDYSNFIDHNVGHVLTGNLKIISNRKVRNLLCKGTKFIETLYCSSASIVKSIEKDIQNYIDKICIRHSVAKSYFEEWKNAVIQDIDNLISSENIDFKGRYKSVINQNKLFWDDFQSKFILAPVDKAGNNVSIICRKYYIDNIRNELENTSTYEQYNRDGTDLVNVHVEFCKNYNIEVEESSRNLPNFYMMPKFHKSPVGSWYIAASCNSSLK